MKYHIRLEKPTSNKPTALFFDCTCPDGRCIVSLKEKVHPADWNTEMQMVNNKGHINQKLAKINREMHMLAFNVTVLTKDKLKTLIQETLGFTSKQNAAETASFLDMCRTITKDRREGRELKEDGKVFKKATMISYDHGILYLEKYIDFIHPAKLTMQDFSISDYKGFLSFLTTKNDLAVNTIGLVIAKLKVFIAGAYSRGWHKNLVFRDPDFKLPSEKVVKISIPMEVLEKMNTMPLKGRFATARDIFLIESFTSLRVRDTMSLTAENIVGNTIVKVSAKKEHKQVIPMHRIVKDVLERNNGRFPSKMALNDLNDYLRRIAKQTGMLDEKVLVVHVRKGALTQEHKHRHEMVTSHSGRRSFITNTRNLMSKEDRMKMAGIKTAAIIELYDKTTEEDVAKNNMENIFFK